MANAIDGYVTEAPERRVRPVRFIDREHSGPPAVRMVPLRSMLLHFWAIWWSIALATNLAELLQLAGVLPARWRWTSGNWRLVQSVMGRVGVPRWIAAAAFVAIVVSQAIAAGLFWRASRSGRGGNASDRNQREVQTAFGASLMILMAFLFADEVFVAYETGTEAAHVRLFIAQLVTLIALAEIPNPQRSDAA